MKKLLMLPIIAFLLISCATSNPAGRFLSSTAVSVDAMMKSWATYVVVKGIPENQQTQVRTLYASYQLSMMIATNAYNAAMVSGDASLFVGPSNQLYLSKTALLNTAKIQ